MNKSEHRGKKEDDQIDREAENNHSLFSRRKIATTDCTRPAYKPKNRHKIHKRLWNKKAQLTDSKGNSNQEELIADIVEDPKYDTSNRKKVKLTDEITDRIKFYLKENEIKRTEGKAKQQKKKIDIYEALKEEGFDIGYTTTCNTIRKINKEAKEAYIRQEYELGEVCEFDWGEVKLVIAGKNKTLQISVFTSAKGDYRSGYLYQNQKTEAFLDTHASFFEEAGGVYKEMVYVW